MVTVQEGSSLFVVWGSKYIWPLPHYTNIHTLLDSDLVISGTSAWIKL